MRPGARRHRIRPGAVVVHVILIAGAGFMLLPMLWMVVTSFKLAGEIAVWPPHLLPKAPTLENYRGLFSAVPFLRFLLNGMFYSVVATVSVVVTSAIAGAVFGKYRFPAGTGRLFLLVFATAIVALQKAT